MCEPEGFEDWGGALEDLPNDLEPNHYWGGAWDRLPTPADIARLDEQEAQLRAVRGCK